MRYTDHRQFSKLLALRAVYHHGLGDDAEVVETVLDAIALAQAVREDSSLISQLVANAMGALTYGLIEDITSTLQVYRADSANNNRQDATAQRVGVLIQSLFDERQIHASALRSALCERMFYIDFIRIATAPGVSIDQAATSTEPVIFAWWHRASAWPMEPIYLSDGVRAIRGHSEFVTASAESTWPDAEKLFTPIDDDPSLLDQVAHPFSGISPAAFQRWLFLHFRLLANRRMAGTALAIRLYELDHGRRPETLAELVPDYLPSVPLDPMATGEKPIGYLPHAEQPILYSVDKNGIDDGGRYMINADGSINRRKYDWPFFLDGPPVPNPDLTNKTDGNE